MVTASHGERMCIVTSSFRVQLNSTTWSVQHDPTRRGFRMYTKCRPGIQGYPGEHRQGGPTMEQIIAKLLQDFEHGKMNRRQLIKSLSVAAAAAAGMATAAQGAGKQLEALYVNHISYQVNDYKKVRDFYVALLGMKVTEDDGKQCRLLFGNNM